MKNRTYRLGAILLALSAAGARADLLWDNNVTPDGFNGRAISPPTFPDIRVAEDFAVPDGQRWTIQDFHAGIIEDSGWDDGGRLDVFVYEDTMGFGPGDQIVHASGAFSKMETGDEYFGRTAYEYWIEGLQIELGPGTYWIGLRNPDGGGSGTNYWLTSDGGRDGADSSTGYFNLGVGWTNTGEGWHHAFEITGVPEPGAIALFGAAMALLFRRRQERT